jgi:Mg-chelatase subunit ChlD
MKPLSFLLVVLCLLAVGLSMATAATSSPLNGSEAYQNENCAIDLMLVLDSSSSIDHSDYYDVMKPWAKDLVARFSLGNDAARVGIVNFSSYANLETGLSIDSTQISTQIDQMVKFDGGTNMWDGLQMASDELYTNGRDDVPHVIILLTDGNPDVSPIDLANAIRGESSTKTVILGVAVGNINMSEIVAIAGGEFNVAQVADFEGLLTPNSGHLGRLFLCRNIGWHQYD